MGRYGFPTKGGKIASTNCPPARMAYQCSSSWVIFRLVPEAHEVPGSPQITYAFALSASLFGLKLSTAIDTTASDGLRLLF